MRTVLFIVQKEFIQVFRNRRMLPIIFILPIVQLIILVQAATFDMKCIRMSLLDMDMSQYSRQMITKFQGSPFFQVVHATYSEKKAQEEMKKGTVDVILQIPLGFEKDLLTQNRSKVQVVIDAINGSTAGLVNAYTSQIIQDFNREVITDLANPGAVSDIRLINSRENYWYNPKLNYKTYMVPGILVLLITIISLLLSGMNIVREKEIGTIEQLNVTPVRKIQFIAGKLIPFWIIALAELAFGLTIGKLLFNIPIIGNLWLIFVSAAVYLLVILSFGLVISTVTNTQQQSMLVSFFFMVIFILMSGLFTAVESMPDWAQTVNRLNPIAYFIRIMRMVMLKGSGFRDIREPFYSLVIYSLVSITFAVRRYRKVT
jgi:ABC-2 type transport system permease protein